MKNYIGVLLPLMLGCNKREVYKFKSTNGCENIKFNAARLYPKENIDIYFDDNIIYKNTIDSLDGFLFSKGFCVKFKQKSKIRIITQRFKKIYIDTTFYLNKESYGYIINITHPLPINWKEYFDKNGIPIKKWGDLPIDSSIRLISVIPDTTKTWGDRVN